MPDPHDSPGVTGIDIEGLEGDARRVGRRDPGTARPHHGPPGCVKVGPHHYTVDPDDRASQRDARGEAYTDRCAIVYDDRMHQSALRETLLHETLHAVWAATGLPAVEGANDEEEVIVASLSPLLLGVLRDNPRLVTFLTADEDWVPR